jgi:hypothetical protein
MWGSLRKCQVETCEREAVDLITCPAFLDDTLSAI